MKQILLVRHGQASFGADVYDALSPTGHEQARILGQALAARGLTADVLVRGSQLRHEETADGILEGLVQARPQEPAPAVVIDSGWNEFDFEHIIEVHEPRFVDRAVMMADRAATERPRQAFQEVFEAATGRWTAAGDGPDYSESFPAFTSRVRDALDDIAAREPERGTALVVSSGGPIGLLASQLIVGDSSAWAALNRVVVNTSVTKVIQGSRGLTLSSFNAHEHLESRPELLTYR